MKLKNTEEAQKFAKKLEALNKKNQAINNRLSKSVLLDTFEPVKHDTRCTCETCEEEFEEQM